jgi:hypothetical protein
MFGVDFCVIYPRLRHLLTSVEPMITTKMTRKVSAILAMPDSERARR